ncbi:MAG: permease [Candidatus Altiarchaeota archaeon]
MNTILATFTVVMVGGYLLSYLKNRGRTLESVGRSLRMLWDTAPHLVVGVWLAGVFLAFMPSSLLHHLTGGGNMILTIPAVCIVGMLFPGQRYTIYPFAAGLAMMGVNVGVVVTFLTAYSLVDPSCVLLEPKMLGWRYFIFRVFLSFLMSVVAGYVTYMMVPDSIMFK